MACPITYGGYKKCSAVAKMGDRLATIDKGRKLGELDTHVTQCNTQWPRPTFVPSGILIHPAAWPQQTWAENWGLCPFGGAGSPFSTIGPGPRPTSMIPSGILIHSAVRPQYTWAENWGTVSPFLGRSWVPI